MERQRRWELERKAEGERTDGEDGENIDQKLQDPGRAMERVLDPAAVPDLRRVEVGDPGTCSGSTVKRWSTRAPGRWASAEMGIDNEFPPL